MDPITTALHRADECLRCADDRRRRPGPSASDRMLIDQLERCGVRWMAIARRRLLRAHRHIPEI